MNARITFGKTATEAGTGWKTVRIYADNKFVGEIHKDTGTHWQVTLYGDESSLKDVNADYDYWHFLFADFDGETLTEAKAEVKAKLGAILAHTE